MGCAGSSPSTQGTPGLPGGRGVSGEVLGVKTVGSALSFEHSKIRMVLDLCPRGADGRGLVYRVSLCPGRAAQPHLCGTRGGPGGG